MTNNDYEGKDEDGDEVNDDIEFEDLRSEGDDSDS